MENASDMPSIALWPDLEMFLVQHCFDHLLTFVHCFSFFSDILIQFLQLCEVEVFEHCNLTLAPTNINALKVLATIRSKGSARLGRGDSWPR